MENSDNLILINIKDYEKLIENDVKYKTLIGTILNPKNVKLCELNYKHFTESYIYLEERQLILNLVENLEPDKYNFTYCYLLEKRRKEKEKIDKDLEKASESFKEVKLDNH